MTKSTHRPGRRQFLKQLGMVAAVGMTGLRSMVSAADTPSPGRQPNILFIFSDDLSYRDLSCYSQWGYFARPAHEDDPLFKNKGPWPKGKFTCTHEGGMRVPFFVYWKGKIKAQESDHVCALYDMLATTADLAGVVPPETDGISLVPTLLSKPGQQREHKYLYWENGTQSSHAQSVRMGPWWAFRQHPSKPIALYDITQDIDCETDLAQDNPDVIEQIRQIVNEAHVDSPWYVNPGESAAHVAAKRQQAQATDQMQTPVKANTLYKGRTHEE